MRKSELKVIHESLFVHYCTGTPVSEDYLRTESELGLTGV